MHLVSLYPHAGCGRCQSGGTLSTGSSSGRYALHGHTGEKKGQPLQLCLLQPDRFIALHSGRLLTLHAVVAAAPVCSRTELALIHPFITPQRAKRRWGLASIQPHTHPLWCGLPIHSTLPFPFTNNHQQRAKRRWGLASTKRVGEIRGSTHKVRQQKGTGRARAGKKQ